MALHAKSITIEDFREFVDQEENSHKPFELINGKIIEVVSPGMGNNHRISYAIAVNVYPFCIAHNIPPYIAFPSKPYHILGNAIAPDFAFKRTPMSDDYPDPIAPEWAVEILSPTDKAAAIAAKRRIYLQAGILYWEIDPEAQRVDVYAPGQPPRKFGIDDTLDGDGVLPGFTLVVKNLF
jgi:Uma2 family endonuclease